MPSPKSEPGNTGPHDTDPTPAVPETAIRALTPEEIAAQETALAAEISAAHAVKAAEQADADDLAARQAAREDDRARLCPNCRAEMIKHGDANPHKRGAWHCNGCGRCWAPGLRQQRPGHVAGSPATV